MSVFQGWRSIVLDEEIFLEIPSSPGFPWVHQPAAARRDKPSAGGEKPCSFPAGMGRKSAVSALLSQPVSRSQVRARSAPASLHKHVGGPLHLLLDLSDPPRF